MHAQSVQIQSARLPSHAEKLHQPTLTGFTHTMHHARAPTRVLEASSRTQLPISQHLNTVMLAGGSDLHRGRASANR